MNMNKVNFDIYQSPFSWRYGSQEMRELFSEINRRKNWRKVWVALAKAQSKSGLITKQELADIIKNQDKVNIEKAQEIEKEMSHDLMAEIKVFASQAKIGGGKIHLGATSQDIEDNADAVILNQAANIVEEKLKKLLSEFAQKIDKNKNLVCMAYTHLQPAEPTTLGYRFSIYAQDLLLDLELLRFTKTQIKGKGTKGAVGTYASYYSLLGQKTQSMENQVLAELGIDAFDVTTQVYPRKLDWLILSALSSIAGSLYKFAFDVRIMQSAGFGEWAEPFGTKQVGSSAMPFKRNPILSERICSIARHLIGFTQTAWQNAANSLLERTLDDSAARRVILPEGFLAVDEIISLAAKIIEGLTINSGAIQKNLTKYGPFAAIESILLTTVKNGADRQKIHEVLRKASMDAHAHIELTGNNPLLESIKRDKQITKYLKNTQIDALMHFEKHIGLAPKKATQIASKIKRII